MFAVLALSAKDYKKLTTLDPLDKGVYPPPLLFWECRATCCRFSRLLANTTAATKIKQGRTLSSWQPTHGGSLAKFLDSSNQVKNFFSFFSLQLSRDKKTPNLGSVPPQCARAGTTLLPQVRLHNCYGALP